VPYGVRLYDSAATPAEIVQAFEAEMPGRGWEAMDLPPTRGEDQRVFTRPGADLLVLTSRNGDRTIVTVLSIRAR
jgi:hypothetical protein